jgi:hypothetical protein
MRRNEMQPPCQNAIILITVIKGELSLVVESGLIAILGDAGNQAIFIDPQLIDGAMKIKFELPRDELYAFAPPIVVNINNGDLRPQWIYDYTVDYVPSDTASPAYCTINVINTSTLTIISSDPSLVNTQAP